MTGMSPAATAAPNTDAGQAGAASLAADGSERARLAALVASGVLALGGAAAWASPASAQQRRALDPGSDDVPVAVALQRAQEVEKYAEVAGVSTAEAAKRLRWQRLATVRGGLVTEAPRELGGAFGGIWIDQRDGGRVKVGVAGGEAADRAKAGDVAVGARLGDGADVVPVRYSKDRLIEISQWLSEQLRPADKEAPLPVVHGIATDDNVVSVEYPADLPATSAQRAVVEEAVKRFGDAVRVTTYAGRPTELACSGMFCEPPLRAGVTLEPNWLDDGPYCTSAFPALKRGTGQPVLMTAGHCTLNGQGYIDTTWSTKFHPGPSGGTPQHNIGQGQLFYEGWYGDAGVISIDNVPGWNPQPYLYQLASSETSRNEAYKIRYPGASTVGQGICTTGAASRATDCGAVTQEWVSDGTVGVLTRANTCNSVQGDSGSPMYKSETAYGVLRGKFSACDAIYTDLGIAQDRTNADIMLHP
jgi:hypothetical protein